MAFWDDIKELIEDPPIWASIIAAVFTVGGAGGIAGILADQPLQFAVQETIRSVPGLLEGRDFAGAWTGQWLTRVKRAAELAGADFARRELQAPTDWLTKDTQYGARIRARYDQLRGEGFTEEGIRNRLLEESIQQCLNVSTDPALCRADVQALAINYHVQKNLYDTTSWDVRSGRPAVRAVRDLRPVSNRQYTIAELDQIWRDAERRGFPIATVAALRKRHDQAVRMRTFAENNGIQWGPRQFPTLTLEEITAPPVDQPPPIVDTGTTPAGNTSSRQSTFAKIATAALATSPVWGFFLGRHLAERARSSRANPRTSARARR